MRWKNKINGAYYFGNQKNNFLGVCKKKSVLPKGPNITTISKMQQTFSPAELPTCGEWPSAKMPYRRSAHCWAAKEWAKTGWGGCGGGTLVELLLGQVLVLLLVGVLEVVFGVPGHHVARHRARHALPRGGVPVLQGGGGWWRQLWLGSSSNRTSGRTKETANGHT